MVENNSPNVMLSDSVLKIERGARHLLKRLPDGKSYVTMVSFRRFSYIPILGNTLDGDGYVYSPDLSLDVLTSEELSVFGFKCAIKTNYENWFYMLTQLVIDFLFFFRPLMSFFYLLLYKNYF